MSWVTPTDVIYRYFLRMKKLFPLNSKFKCFSLLIFFGVCFVIRRTSRFEWTTLVFVRRKWKGQWLSQKAVFSHSLNFWMNCFFRSATVSKLCRYQHLLRRSSAILRIMRLYVSSIHWSQSQVVENFRFVCCGEANEEEGKKTHGNRSGMLQSNSKNFQNL